MMSYISKEINNTDIIGEIKKWMWIILLISCLFECLFYFSDANFLGCLSLVYGWFLISNYVFCHANIKRYPLPTIAIFGYGFCYYFLPIIITLIEGKPLTFNFQVPYLTFVNHFFSVTIIVLAFKVCIFFYRENNILNTIWNKIGYMTPPSDKIIWIFAVVGLLAMTYNIVYFHTRGDAQATGNALNITLNVFASFAYCPICLYFKSLYCREDKSYSKKYVKYYMIIVIIIGIASTRRHLIFAGFFSIVLMWFFLVLYKNQSIFTKKNVVVALLGGYLFTGPISDLASAMILNRQMSFSNTASSTFNEVIDLMRDKEALHTAFQAYLANSENGGDNSYCWSEYYVNNIFLDRYCNLRVMDATIYNAQSLGFANKRGQEYYKEYWINQVPSPIANEFNLRKTVRGTAVDEMLSLNFINKYGRGFKVGGETGIGLWMFGYSYYIIAFITYVIVFYFMCSFVNFTDKHIFFPFPLLVSFGDFWVTFLNANGIFSIMSICTRNNLNSILIYCIVFFFLRIVTNRKSAV